MGKKRLWMEKRKRRGKKRMSSTELLIFYKKKWCLFEEYHNSYKGAFLLWEELWNKFFSDESFPYLPSDERLEKLWRLDQDPRLSRDLKILLCSTFDHFLIKRENIPRFIEAIKNAIKNDELNDFGHFSSYARDLENFLKKKEKFKAIGWIQTTVCDDVWMEFEDKKCRCCGDVKTIKRKYDLSKDKKHRFVFEHLNQLEK